MGKYISAILLLFLLAPCFTASAQESSPALVHGNRLFFFENRRLTVLDIADGSMVKTHPDLSLYGGKLLPAGNNVVAGVDEAGLVKTCLFDGTSGELFWTAKMRFALVDGESVICVDGEDVVAVDARIGKEKWRLELSLFPTMLTLLDNRLIVHGEQGTRGTLTGIDPATGKKLWESDASGAAGKAFARSEKCIFIIWTSSAPFSMGDTVKAIRCWSSDGGVQAPPATVPVDLAEALRELQAGRIEALAQGLQLRKQTWKWRNPTNTELERLGLAREKSLGAWELRDGGVLVASASYNRAAKSGEWWREDNPQPTGTGQQVCFLDGKIAWSATPGYMNTGQSNPLLWVAGDGDCLVVSSQLGQVECLERRSGRSRWLYVYPADDATLGNADCWSPFRLDGTFSARLQRYRERAAGVGVTGSVPDGEPPPKSFRIVASPNSNQKYEYLDNVGKTYFLTSAMLFLVLLGTLAVDSRHVHPKQPVPGFVGALFNAGKSPLWAALSAVLLLLGGFMLYWRYGGYSPASLATTGLALIIAALYLGWKTCKTGTRAGRRFPGVLTLFPFSLLFALICLQVAWNILGNILGFLAMLILVAMGPR